MNTWAGNAMMTLTVLAVLAVAARGQEGQPEPEQPKKPKPIVITATRWEADPFDTSRAVTVVGPVRIAERNQLSILDALNDQIGIWVEKRTATTSDAVIRGWSGSNILALIDGNTLSTLWGEGGFAGDDMYGKVDSEMVQRIEVVRGPASVLYGSNAFAGVINFITRDPAVPYAENGTNFGFRSKLAWGSAAQAFTFRQELSLGTPGTRWLVGASYRDIGDARGGKGVGVMDPTRGEEVNLDVKGIFLLQPNMELTLTAQDVTRDPVFRFYRPTQDNRNDRRAIGATLDITEVADWLDQFQARVYYQNKIDRRTWYTDESLSVVDDYGWAKYRTIAGGVQGRTRVSEKHRLTWGVMFELDDGESPDDEQFTIVDLPSGTKTKDAPDSVWDDLGFFLQSEWEISGNATLTASLRWDRFRFDSDVDQYYTPPVGDPMLDDIEMTETMVSGGLALLYELDEEIHLTGSWFRGFRLWPPKFGITQHGLGLYAPSGILPPVVADTLEAGVKVRVPGVIEGSGFVYYTWISDNQVWQRGMFLGQDWYDWDSSGDRALDGSEDIWVKTSTGKAYVYGVELDATIHLNALWDAIPASWTLRAGFAWNIGNDEETDDPLRHTQPARLLLAARWTDPDPEGSAWFEVLIDMVRRYDRVSDSRLNGDVGYLRDPQDGGSGLYRDYGLPGYTIYNVRGGVDLDRGVALTVSLENVGHKHFRRAHSRWDEMGFNAIIGIELTEEAFSRNR
jgi:hemoglobin/transferrin/lactoferrin receptor protein